MSTHTTSGLWNRSSEPNLSLGSSPTKRHKNSVPKSIFNPTSPTKTSSWPPSLKRSWEQSYSSFQTTSRAQCPCMHYHPWCNECQTLMEWEPLPPISLTHMKQTPTIGDLKLAVREKSHYQFLFATQTTTRSAIKKVCSMWREEQFAKAIAKRSAKIAAREALHRSVHQQRTAHGAAPRVI